MTFNKENEIEMDLTSKDDLTAERVEKICFVFMVIIVHVSHVSDSLIWHHMCLCR